MFDLPFINNPILILVHVFFVSLMEVILHHNGCDLQCKNPLACQL